MSIRSDEAILGSLVDDLPLGVWVARAPGGEFVYANARFGEIMGAAGRDDVQRGGYAEPYGIYGRDGALYPEDRMPFVRALEARRTVMVDDIVIHRGDGTRVDVRAHARPIFDLDGDITHVVIAFADITSEIDAHRALDELAEEQAFVLAHMGDFVYRHDLGGHFTYLSPAVERITGHSVEAWQGHYTQFMTDHPVNAKVDGATRAALETGERQLPYLVEIRHADGRPIMLEISERPYRVDGVVAGIVGVARDVTRRHEAETEVRALARRLAAKNQELESIIHVASHDLRTPLISLDGFATELCDLVESLAPGERASTVVAEARLLADRIGRSVERLDRRLDGLLQLSRLGRAEPAMSAVDVDRVVREVLEDLTAQIEQAAATVEVGDLPTCRGDRVELGRLWTNLLDNALKYLRPGVAGRIVVRGVRDEDVVRYTVADNGVGIEPAFRDKVFRVFHRLDPRAAPGEGLGLTIAHRIVARHAGTIEISDNPGGGTRFTVVLPVA
ncbi:MAG: PAS domain-containing sensor histidine kinase [Myxococcales bacterium]|nr:PAS domain-containing sensor histidine kinase [Myxococcales bacterium]